MTFSTAFISALPVTTTSPCHSQLALRHVNRQRFSVNSLPSRRTTTCMSVSEPPSGKGKQPTAQDLAKLYGGSYLGTSISMSIISYAVFYALVYVGVDVRSLTNSFGNWLATTPLGRPAALDNISDAASVAAIAYVAHKVTSPLRFPLTIAATPIVANIFSSSKQSSTSEENKQ